MYVEVSVCSVRETTVLIIYKNLLVFHLPEFSPATIWTKFPRKCLGLLMLIWVGFLGLLRIVKVVVFVILQSISVVCLHGIVRTVHVHLGSIKQPEMR